MKKILVFCLLFLSFPISTNAMSPTQALVDFSSNSIEEIQEYVKTGRLNYETITRTYLDRINAYQEQYDSIISINESAIDEAKQLDKVYQETGALSMVHGIPIIVKDNIDVLGMPTTAGALGLINNYPNVDAPIIANLKEAGAIIIAKANMDEFAYNSGMSSSMFGLVKNAYDLNISAYGSSGGSASAVASNLAVAGIGTDTGVSIRVPSAAHNLYGFRPSKELLSSEGIIQFDSSRDTAGPMTKHASDARILIDIMSGVTSNQDKDLNSVRVGIIRSKVNEAPAFMRNMMNETIAKMKTAGVTFVDVPLPNISYEFNSNNFCYEFNTYIKNTSGPIQSLQDLINSGEYRQYIGSYIGNYCNKDFKLTQSYQDYLKRRDVNIDSMNQFYKTHNIDAVVFPTIAETLQALSPSIRNKMATYSYMIAPATGFPSMNVPIGFHQGLPYGMDITGKENQEGILLSLAELVDEESTYNLPNISPSLYTPISSVDQLFEIIETEHTHPTYLKIQEDISTFLYKHADYQYHESVARHYIEQYEGNAAYVAQLKLEAKEKKALKIKIVLSVLTIFGLVLSLLIIRKKRSIRRRRRRLRK